MKVIVLTKSQFSSQIENSTGPVLGATQQINQTREKKNPGQVPQRSSIIVISYFITLTMLTINPGWSSKIKSTPPKKKEQHDIFYNNQINARALIGQSAVVYCASKHTEKSRVF